MRNYLQRGDVLTLPAPYAVASGGGALIGTIFGVAEGTYAQGQLGAFAVENVFVLAKANGAVTLGQKLYWDDAAKNVTTTAAGNTLIGAAVTAQAAGDVSVTVRLNGSVS